MLTILVLLVLVSILLGSGWNLTANVRSAFVIVAVVLVLFCLLGVLGVAPMPRGWR